MTTTSRRSAGPGTAVPLHVLRDRDEVAAALAAAADLLAATGAPVCARATWLTTWYETFPQARPVALVAGRPDRPDGLACLAVRRRGVLRTVTLGGTGPSDYGRLPARDEATADALAGGLADLLGSLAGPWRLRLAQLPVGDPVAGALLRALPHAHTVPGQGCPQLAFVAERTLEKHVTASARRGGRQAHGRIERAGLHLTVERVADPGGVGRLLPEIVALKRARDHDLGRRSDLDEDRMRAFYTEVVSRQARAGATEVFALRLDGQLAAYFLGFRDGDVFRNWDGRISSRWPSLSLGQLLRNDMIGRLLAEPELSGIDWCRGELPHKMHSITEVTPAVDVQAESSPLVRDALEAAAWARRAARSKVPTDVLRRLRGGSARA